MFGGSSLRAVVRTAPRMGCAVGLSALVVGVGLTGSAASVGHGSAAVTPVGVHSSTPRPTAAIEQRDANRLAVRVDQRTRLLREQGLQAATTARTLRLRQQAAAADGADRALRRAGARAAGSGAAVKRPAATSAASLPVRSGYRLAARFGAVGSWSRYHTGLDFSSPVGTPVHTPAAGVVTVAGSGPASGWAGSYVVVAHADGNSTLYAHLASAGVRVGQRVDAGARVGTVGLTGRTFGAHLHFELYPAGTKPGDVYAAVDPSSWLARLGLRP